MDEKKKILVVDDDHDLADVLADKLSVEGYETMTAYDGQEGLEKALKEHPDVILLDILMPNLDGWEVIDRLHADEWGKGAKVILLTNLSDMESISQAVEKQAYHYLVKTDLSLEDVVKRVRDELSK